MSDPTKKPNPVIKFVKQHKTAILTTALVTTTTLAVIQQRGLQLHNDFLKEKGLFDEFYFVPEDVV